MNPNPLVRGRGFGFLESRGIKVEVGTCRAAAVLLNQPFFTLMNERRPFVTLKLGASLDGRTATSAGESKWITGPKAGAPAFGSLII